MKYLFFIALGFVLHFSHANATHEVTQTRTCDTYRYKEEKIVEYTGVLLTTFDNGKKTETDIVGAGTGIPIRVGYDENFMIKYRIIPIKYGIIVNDLFYKPYCP